MDAILIAIAHIADVDSGRDEIDDVASSLTMLEQQVAQCSIGQGSSEVVLGCHGHSFQGHTASAGTISQQYLLGATNQLAINKRVAHIKGYGLQAAGIGQQLEASGVAVFEDDRSGLIAVRDRRQSRIGRRVIDASEGEIDCRDFANSAVDGERTASASHLMQNTINVVIDGAATEACANRCVSDAGASNNGFAHAASKQGFAIAGSGPSSAGTSKPLPG